MVKVFVKFAPTTYLPIYLYLPLLPYLIFLRFHLPIPLVSCVYQFHLYLSYLFMITYTSLFPFPHFTKLTLPNLFILFPLTCITSSPVQPYHIPAFPPYSSSYPALAHLNYLSCENCTVPSPSPTVNKEEHRSEVTVNKTLIYYRANDPVLHHSTILHAHHYSLDATQGNTHNIPLTMQNAMHPTHPPHTMKQKCNKPLIATSMNPAQNTTKATKTTAIWTTTQLVPTHL